MGLKVAILGLSESTRHMSPWDTDWQVWGLAWDSERYRMDCVFEMHDREQLKVLYGERLPEYLEQISHCANLMTRENYPFDEVERVTGDYWMSSISYAIALAIYEHAAGIADIEEIALYGVDANDDYGYQRPNLEYLIGFARGRGIKVHIPQQSPLCKYVYPEGLGCTGRYGVTQ